MIELTKRDIETTVRCGDVAVIRYRRTDGTAKVLRYFEGGRATHAVECMGGFDTFEETIGGGMYTNLRTYLVGNADVTIRRHRLPLDLIEDREVRKYYLSLVGKGYGWDSIKRSMITVPTRRFIKPRAPALAGFIIGGARTLLPGDAPDCSAAWIEAMRLIGRDVLRGYEPSEVDPETLLRDRYLVTAAAWKAPVMVD